jgi:putative transposase
VPEDGHQRSHVLQLEEENSRLKQIVADLTLDKQMLQDVLKKR